MRSSSPAEGCLCLKLPLFLIDVAQVTGALVVHLQKVCRNLKELGLARCKNVDSLSVRRVFESCPALESLNLSFLEVQAAFEVID